MSSRSCAPSVASAAFDESPGALLRAEYDIEAPAYCLAESSARETPATTTTTATLSAGLNYGVASCGF